MLIARQRTLRDGSPLPPLLRRGGEAGRGEARRGERRGGRFFFSRLSTKLFPRNRRNRTAAAKFSPPFSDPLDCNSLRETIIFRKNFLSRHFFFLHHSYRNECAFDRIYEVEEATMRESLPILPTCDINFRTGDDNSSKNLVDLFKE